MNHISMSHSEERPIPDTSSMTEVTQLQPSVELRKWHEQGIKGTGVKIAVLDTGIDTDNRDITYVRGINFSDEDPNNFEDLNGHGTKISGIICARENGYNLLGIAPDCQLYIAKVANDHGNVMYEDLIQGIEWAIEQEVDIINISLEFPQGNPKLHQAIKAAAKNNITVLSSSGNISKLGDTSLAYPGAYPEVINVGMLNVEGEIFSEEFVHKKVDVFAPGEDIFSLYLEDTMTLDTGVSFATAFATGYTALAIQDNREQNKVYDRMTLVKELNQYLKAIN